MTQLQEKKMTFLRSLTSTDVDEIMLGQGTTDVCHFLAILDGSRIIPPYINILIKPIFTNSETTISSIKNSNFPGHNLINFHLLASVVSFDM